MRDVTPGKASPSPSPATIARVELLLRTWLRADDASERAWDEACRARKEAADALLAAGGEIDLDGWRYVVGDGDGGMLIYRSPIRNLKWKRGAP